jgi:hypothetical protein
MKAIFNKQMIWPFIFLLFGLLFFAIGSGLTYRQRTFEKQGIEAQGVVVGLQENRDSDGSTYTTVVQFKTASGQSVEFVSSYSSSPPAYEVGELVIVIYQSQEQEHAIIMGDGQLLHVIFMLVGGVIVTIGSYLMYSTLRDLTALTPEG